MTPFSFANPSADWERFTAAAACWKPSGYDAEMATRLAYYLDDQLDDLRAELKRRFPETHATLTPVTIPLVRLLTQEAAKVFLSTTKLELVEPDQDQPGEGLSAWWKGVLEQMGLGLRLKRCDAYTTLLRTAGLKVSYDRGADRFCAHVVFPQNVRVVMDPEAPMDLDRAHGVAVKVAGANGISGQGERWEFWCAREGEELHGILTVTPGVGEEAAPQVAWQADIGDPLRGPGGHAIVPLVLFTAHTEEMGLFSTEGRGLVEANRGLNVLATDIQHIAEQQGFGVLVLTTTAGAAAPSKLVRAPNTAISLPEGVTAAMLDPGAPIAELAALEQLQMKLAAVTRGLPAGAVSVEARGIASGVALQIEMRPLLEQRADAIEVYREPVRRLWDVIRATHNAYRGQQGFLGRLWARIKGELGEIPESVEMRWTPGDVALPVDDAAALDSIVAEYKAGFCSRPEAVAKRRGITVEEAKKVIEAIDSEEGEEPEGDVLDLEAKRREMMGEPPAGEEIAADEPTVAAVPGAPGAEVVQDTALNGAQVDSLVAIVESAVGKDLPLEAARVLVEAAFPGIRPELVDRLFAALKSAKPPKPAPAQFPPQRAPAAGGPPELEE